MVLVIYMTRYIVEAQLAGEGMDGMLGWPLLTKAVVLGASKSIRHCLGLRFDVDLVCCG